MGDQFAELSFADLDVDVLAWGVANPDGTVRACLSRQDAEIDAGLAARIPLPDARQARQQITSVYPLACYHPDQGWTYAAIGLPVAVTTNDDGTGGMPLT